MAFGSNGVICENYREEQRKIIRYNHLVANFAGLSQRGIDDAGHQELIDEGDPVIPSIVARMSPYKIEHINRFGSYQPRFESTAANH